MEHSYSEVKPRRHFRASDAAHFIFTGLCLLCSGHLLFFSPECEMYNLWNTILFFGSLIWMVYLVLTLVVQFANKGTRIFLSYLDFVFFAFHALMGVWAWFFLTVDHKSIECRPRWGFWLTIYRVFACIALLALVSVLFMSLLRLVNKGKRSNTEIIGTNIEGSYADLDQSAL